MDVRCDGQLDRNSYRRTVTNPDFGCGHAAADAALRNQTLSVSLAPPYLSLPRSSRPLLPLLFFAVYSCFARPCSPHFSRCLSDLDVPVRPRRQPVVANNRSRRSRERREAEPGEQACVRCGHACPTRTLRRERLAPDPALFRPLCLRTSCRRICVVAADVVGSVPSQRPVLFPRNQPHSAQQAVLPCEIRIRQLRRPAVVVRP